MDSYMNNELLVETNHEVLRHLESCPSCSAELEARTRIKGHLKAVVQAQPVPEDLEARLRAALRQETHRSSNRWTRWVAAAAAILVLGVGAGLILEHRSRLVLPDISDRPAQDIYIQKVSASLAAVLKVGLGDHIHCSIFRKYPKNPPTVEEMGQKMGPAYKDLVHLVKSRVPGNYRILLAHQCGYGGRRFVHLTLTNGSNLLSLIITRKQPGETLETMTAVTRPSGVAVYEASATGYDVASFETDQFLAYVVSDLGSKQNLQIAETLAPSVYQFLAAIRS
jgi:hypothetical protein